MTHSRLLSPSRWYPLEDPRLSRGNLVQSTHLQGQLRLLGVRNHVIRVASEFQQGVVAQDRRSTARWYT